MVSYLKMRFVSHLAKVDASDLIVIRLESQKKVMLGKLRQPDFSKTIGGNARLK